MITLRFVTGDDVLSNLIKLQAGVCMPWTPIHVEAVSSDGKAYLGQHFDGGMQRRPIGYDAGHAGRLELFVSIPADIHQFYNFHTFLQKHIGDAYDWKAIVSFADPDENLHTPHTSICSAIQTLALREAGIFKWPLVVPAHHVSPRDLFLILSTHVEIPH